MIKITGNTANVEIGKGDIEVVTKGYIDRGELELTNIGNSETKVSLVFRTEESVNKVIEELQAIKRLL